MGRMDEQRETAPRGSSPVLPPEWRGWGVVPDRWHVVVTGDVTVLGGVIVVGGDAGGCWRDTFCPRGATL